jgi:UDP-N-acetylglucosamine diphosphorylase / glucose-1-phosphate thymidylyltransferase / UDP-N-acetylgalactosamine diphosphorylase / glucosamine-1-phosphate N-acetyltransferase / galactosamine-1-phosphate N-acetyltransferase
MDSLGVSAFFALDKYKHAKLFEGCTFVWEALNHLVSYLEAHSLGKIEIEIPPSATLVNPHLISIGKGSVVEPGAYIQGPCMIGPNSIIRHGAYLRGNILTGEGCVIGHDTEIKNSILLDRVCAAHFNYVGDSILGNEVNLGAGTKCANLRLDHAPVFISYEGQKIATELRKFGLIAGDGAQVGCNCVTNPGTLLGRKSLLFPCLNVSGYVPPNAKVKPSQKNLVEKL